ncbi:hypothetical protein BFW38_08550 [Terasakiispira papahanaumokuakeensis]|uniref:Acylphosphatase n=1 Tax=Terasakiispira papahanaumokuakeensis TaxID=197479 RepID=A0A1E2V9T3_9GAMM|nr:acylphosphatase [Terasakiispira papahanaumokuakeensis]ODC03586.1 hypothetical protein BFW38_08550 [Terasakiispira papahanaumokuakeensis]
MSEEQHQVKARVRGRVQGVWFRKHTQQTALRLGLDGWAVNCDDGSVEVVFQGTHEAVDQGCQWLWTGSPMSRVDQVEIVSFIGEVPAGFFTG